MKPHIILLIAKIDEKISHQLNAIIHHPRFQQLEALWRGLHYLTEIKAEVSLQQIKIKCLSLSVSELIKDTLNSVDFDQSQLFKKIYTDEFDMPGGEPYGILIGDYAFSHKSINEKLTNSVGVLTALAAISAAAFSPLILGLAPSLIGLDCFSKLEKPIDLYSLFAQIEYRRWNQFRLLEDSRFIGFVLPKILMRQPFTKYTVKKEVPYFSETITAHQHYLWGQAGFCFAEVVLRSFAETGWFLNMRGMDETQEGKGFTTGPAAHHFEATRRQPLQKYITEVNLVDKKEDILNQLGFIVLGTRNLMEGAVFYSTPSIQRVDVYEKKVDLDNAYLSTLLNHILCAARFAHTIKIIIRNKIGSYRNADECKRYLQQWILKYCASTTSNKTSYPLREAKVEMGSIMNFPGKYMCRIDITPHYQLDRVESSIQFRSQVSF